MFITYGTKEYYEAELAKAKFAESAIKKYVKDCLAKNENTDDAQVLYCYAELISEAETATKKAQTLYDDFIAKEKKTDENN